MAEVILNSVIKRFGADIALDDVTHDSARRLVRGAARADGRGQDHDAAHGLGP